MAIIISCFNRCTLQHFAKWNCIVYFCIGASLDCHLAAVESTSTLSRVARTDVLYSPFITIYKCKFLKLGKFLTHSRSLSCSLYSCRRRDKKKYFDVDLRHLSAKEEPSSASFHLPSELRRRAMVFLLLLLERNTRTARRKQCSTCVHTAKTHREGERERAQRGVKDLTRIKSINSELTLSAFAIIIDWTTLLLFRLVEPSRGQTRLFKS